MTCKFRLLVFLFTILLGATGLVRAEEGGTLLLRQPTLAAGQIAFVHAGDIWIANRDGGSPRRLTVHAGVEGNPYFSPDGKWIAFSGYYDGNLDVFVIARAGGQPRRLTYHPGGDLTCGWSRDGKRVLFSSRRISTVGAYQRLFTVPCKGGFPQVLPMPMAERGSFSPDDRYIAYTPLRDATTTWKRYRGGRTTPIWIFDLTSKDHREIPHINATDTNPVWIGNRIYFLSDRNHTMNVFVYDLVDKKVRQLTRHSDFDVKWLAGDKEGLIYEQAHRLHLLDPTGGTTKSLTIHLAPDLPATRSHFEKAAPYIQDMNISPRGVRAVFAARGEILTVPVKKGHIRNLTRTPGVHDRDPAWSPDGQRIAWFADTGGEYALHLADQAGMKKPECIPLGDPTFYHRPQWSPDGNKILYTDKRLKIFYLDLKTKEPVLVDQDNYDKVNRTIDPSWSPDSRWITYTKQLDNKFRAVFLYSLATKKAVRITDGLSDAISASFSRDGKYLFFLASTNFGLNTAWLDMSSFDRPVRRNIYVVVLDQSKPSPFAPESDEEKTPAKPGKKTEKTKIEKAATKAKEAKKTKAIRIDLAGIDQRILALPLPAGNYVDLATAAEGKVFYIEFNDATSRTNLRCFDMKSRKGKTFLENIRAYRISQDGKKLLYSARQRRYAIVGTQSPPAPGSGSLNLTGAMVPVNPREEWRQIFNETWRVFRDYFYVANMHGADWPAMGKKYRPFLAHVGHRIDLNYLLAEMTGELVCGHVNVRGGDYPDIDLVPVGLLGADFEIVNNRYRFKKIYSGQSWNPDLRAPLTQPGIKVTTGDYLLAVNGIPLTGVTNMHSLFDRTAGKMVRLKINDKPETKGARQITVVPLASDSGLRMRDWVEGNRRRVDKLSGGRLAYVYMPNTAGSGYTYFNRYYFSGLDKEGVVIDERFNGGGKVADYILNMLDRKLLCYWGTREGKPFTTPNACIFGPKAMVINEYAGSGGDAMPYFFQRGGLGKLVGKRTWGGLVGIYDYPRLIDGGRITAPRMGIYSPDGKWVVENVGVSPDLEVEMTPKVVIAGKDPQLEAAVKVVMDELTRNPQPKTPLPPPPVRVR